MEMLFSDVASNGLDFGEVDKKNIINHNKLKGGKKEGLLKYCMCPKTKGL